MEFRNRYSPSLKVTLNCSEEERMTKSEFAKDCDINNIMARYKKTGRLPEFALSAQARFGDFSQVPTYQEMHDKIVAADELFSALPAAVRRQFDNDPHRFIAAADTVEGRELLVKLGLGQPVVDDRSVGDPPSFKGVVSEPLKTTSSLEEVVPAAGVPSKSVKKGS